MVWSRAELKMKAKGFLKGNYWKTFLVTLIITFLVSSINFKWNLDEYRDINFITSFFVRDVVLYYVLYIFVINVLKVGLVKYFIEGEKGDVNIDYILYYFKHESYLNIVKVMFLQDLYIFLWSLLFVIPGIVKAYQYQFIPYLLAEEPTISSDEAFLITKGMTNNQKIDMFVLDLSFIGWYILGAFVFIGSIFVVPYHEATRFQLYKTLKHGDSSEGENKYNG